MTIREDEIERELNIQVIEKIRAYWRSRGTPIEVWMEPASGARGAWAIRSLSLNGIPLKGAKRRKAPVIFPTVRR